MRLVLVVALVAVLVAAAVAGLVYRDQIVRRATHLKGGPTRTVAWTPFPPGDPPRLHLAVAGDIGHGGSRVRATARAVTELHRIQPFDGLVLNGDNVYPSGDPAGLTSTVFGPFADLLTDTGAGPGPDPDPDTGAGAGAGVRLYAVLGNHDVMRASRAAGQVAALGMPGRWWAEHLDGDVLLVGIDSNRPDDREQQAWLEQSLSTATERWRVVVLHHPPYSAGYQGSSERVRRAFVPLFERYGVQLVIAGHDHDYQRSVPLDGVTYLVTGGAAGTRRTGEDDFTAVSFSWHHFVELAVFDDRLVVRAVNPDHRVADEATLRP